MTDQDFTDVSSGLADETSMHEAPGPTVVMDDPWSPPETVDSEISARDTHAEESAVSGIDGDGDAPDAHGIVPGAADGRIEPDVMLASDVPEPEATFTPDATEVDNRPEDDVAISPAILVTTLVETAARRRNKRRHTEDPHVEAMTPGPAQDELRQPTSDAGEVSGAAEDETGDNRTSIEPAAYEMPADDVLDPAWREHWPDNEVRLVGQLLPRVSDAPALDGVQRTRVELSLVENHAGAFGTIANLPVFVMPGAPGFTSIYNEIRRARNQDRRLKPILVEMEGILRQMPDRDTRYANERYSVLMGVEVHKITRAASDTEQFGYWRGRVTVIASRRYEYRGMPYQRVTGVVALKQRKPRLRGTSVTHIPVDFLVAPEHEHADRFQHIGQRLLIEATIAGDVHRMHPDHPDLEGLDPRRKAQLQLLRQAIVTVALGEFPDDAAERDYQAWVAAGRPRPRRQQRESRLAVAQRSSTDPTAAGDDEQVVAQAGNRHDRNVSGLSHLNGHRVPVSAGEGKVTKERGRMNNHPS
jgi:hypothetical protein